MENVMQWSGVEVTDKKRTFTALLLIPVLLFAMACDWGAWTVKANQIIAEAAPAVGLIIQLLPLFGAPVPPVVGAAITAWTPQIQEGLTLLGGLLIQLQNAAQADKAPLMDKIQAQIDLVQAKLASILPTLHILNADLQAKITAIVGAIDDAVKEVSILVNAAQGKTAQAKAIRVGYMAKDGKSFKKHFNDVLHATTGNPAIDNATIQVELR